MLQRVSIQNFKSLKDVTLDLQKVNLLIGPNNSGKTNFLKAITSFEKDSEIGQMSFKRKTGEIRFDFTYLFNSDGRFYETVPSKLMKYSRSVITELRGDSFFTDYTKHKNLTFINEFNEEQFQGETPFLEEFYQYIKVPIYKLNPDNIQSSSQYRSEHQFKEDGSNILQFLQFLYSRIPFEFEKLVDDFSKITNDFAKIRMPDTQPGMFQLQLYDNFGLGYSKDDVSEGVLYFLMLLCIVYQPFPPKLLLLEEPERGIHPRRIHEVMNFIFQLAEEKDVQIILTTHNENVLNYFSNSPESVFVFDKNEEGATQVRNLKRDIIEPSHQRSRENGFEPINYTENLGENWMYGILGGVPEETL